MARPTPGCASSIRNGTESNLLLRSLQRALYKDEGGRRITEPNAGPLFADTQPTTTISRAARSMSCAASPTTRRRANIATLIHKIGVTGGDGAKRGSPMRASTPTFLLADVEIVATYKLFNINRTQAGKPDPPRVRARAAGPQISRTGSEIR